MDTQNSDSSLAQAIYVQQKLEAFYNKTYGKLYRFKDALLILQEVLVWRRAFTTLLLYVAIHGTFVYLVQNSQMTALSLIGNGMLWCLMIDAVARAALRDGRGLSARVVRYESQLKPVAFDSVMLKINTPKEPQQLASFEIICLRIAQVWMWLDNLQLAFCYWFINEPLTCAAMVAISGFVLSVVGKLVPTIVIMYIAVMAVVVFPFMEFYEQRKRIMDFLNARCPRLVEQVRRLLVVIQNLRSPSNDDNPELSLYIGGERETQEVLTAEFQQAMVQKGTQVPATQVTPVATNVLEDSFGGTPFGSISNLDNSLNLPSFTPQMLEQHRRNRLDPFTDSLDLSLGSDFTDSGRHHHTLTRVDEAEEEAMLPPPDYTAQPGFHVEPPPPYDSMYSNESSTPETASTAPYMRHVTNK